ncbi:ABC transporter substrate-binding protein [Marinobacter sp. chi1]|uniref:ABC transporter substrate-binding protein n=1 Tax=Marinobacter suaedae TaxID=3057675 RepID=A0ABT8VZD0_9GAMM|nr:ABC transporter substrate-binding protein [Marinobacter sp. chi1]MDO3721327.1 ABC transporter substrate-binding protein [Marinobacter sp. chi1]
MPVLKIVTRSTLLAVLFCYSFLASASGTRPNVVFLSPDDSRFWNLVSGFMTAVATDLEMDLEVLVDEEEHRFSYLKLARKVLNRPEKPDYLVFMCKENVTTQMLSLANAVGVKVFTFNTQVPEDTRAAVGSPRDSMLGWLGHLSADNVAAGEMLTRFLEQQVRQQGIVQSDQPVPLIALGGTLDSSASKDRSQGLMAAADGQGIDLAQLVSADWNGDAAAYKTGILLKRYPDTRSVWSASDGMALGALDAVKQVGLVPGKDILVGGVDWEPRALDAIERGEMAVSLGRHFMAGGLLMVLLHDYHHGQDFASQPEDSVLQYKLHAVTRENVEQVQSLLNPDNWQAVDFRRFSRVHHPEQASALNSADQLLDAFTDALAGSGAKDVQVTRAEPEPAGG